MDTGKLSHEEKQLCTVMRSVVCGEPCPDYLDSEAFKNIFDNGSWFTVKGITLRQLYPVPELRPSGDEDIRVKEENFDSFVARLLDLGFQVSFEDERQSILKKEL